MYHIVIRNVAAGGGGGRTLEDKVQGTAKINVLNEKCPSLGSKFFKHSVKPKEIKKMKEIFFKS
jgi:hypothetical protein